MLFTGKLNAHLEEIDQSATVIRLYEFENTKTDVTLKLGSTAKKIWLCNLMEERQTLLAENTDTVTFPVEPFGIETLLIEEGESR